MNSDKSNAQSEVKMVSKAQVHRQFGKDNVLSVSKPKKSFAFICIVSLAGFLSLFLESDKRDFRGKHLSGIASPGFSEGSPIDVPLLEENIDSTPTRSKSSIKSTKRSSNKRSLAFTRSYSPPELFSVKKDMDILKGSIVKAKLLTGASDGLVKAIALSPLKDLDGDEIFPKGSILIGQGKSGEQRLYVNFSLIILPSGEKNKISASAMDLSDKTIGLKGKRFKAIVRKVLTSAGLDFISGTSSALQGQQVNTGNQPLADSLKDAMVLGSVNSTLGVASDYFRNTGFKKEIVHVKNKKVFLLIFN